MKNPNGFFRPDRSFQDYGNRSRDSGRSLWRQHRIDLFQQLVNDNGLGNEHSAAQEAHLPFGFFFLDDRRHKDDGNEGRGGIFGQFLGHLCAHHTGHHDIEQDHADDYNKYLAGLICRIGYGPVGKPLALYFEAPDNLPLVRIAAARLTDTLLNFLEWLKQSDPQSIKIVAVMEDKSPFIEILLQGPDGSFRISDHGKKLNAFRRRFRICGLILKPDNEGFRLDITEDASEKLLIGSSKHLSAFRANQTEGNIIPLPVSGGGA